MMKKIFVVLFFTSVSIVFAGKGSIYSRFGVGELNTFLGGKSTGMGGTGISLFGDSYINFINPAGNAQLTQTLFSVSYQYKNLQSEDNSGQTILGMGNLNSFGIAFPVYSPRKMVLTLGLLPFSSIGYEQQQTTTAQGNQIKQTYEGRGGISSGQLGLSYAVNSDLMLGINAQYLFGAIYKDQIIDFSSAGYYGGSFNETYSLSGIAFTLGGIYSGIDKAFGFSDNKSMNLGFTLFSGSSLDFDSQTLRNFSTNQDTVENNDQTIDLPIGFSFGLSYVLNKTLFTGDVHFQNWDNFTVNGVHPAEIKNSFRLGVGIEFLPESNFFGDEFYKRMSYRFGGYYHSTNLKLQGQSIDEMFSSAGVSFPMSIETRMHLGLEYGIRGTTASNLIKDTLLRFTVSVSAFELMFIQPPIE